MEFEPAASLTEKIADQLGSEIIAGRLQPRSRIQELKVAAELGVSRGSVREALLILERRYLVEILPRRGAVVSALETEELANCSELVTELQASFYSKLARRRGLRLEPFEGCISHMARAVQDGDLDGALDARRAFAAAGFAQLQNFYLVSVLKGLIPAGLRLTYLAAAHPDYDLRDNVRFHQSLLKTLGEGNAEQAAHLVHAFNGRERKLALCSLEERLTA
ncbi:MAG: GntR family transcriptional regulator [Gammaproteobacteria bacterium]|nr:GntR family transcriptional regulator [Gammaproteobacteria bacterium]